MKQIIVTSWLRVGSTLVCEILRSLMQRPIAAEYLDVEREYNSAISDEEKEKILNLDPQLIKTHCYSAKELVSVVPKSTTVIAVRRNFYDTIVSYILYNRHVRLQQGLYIDPRIVDVIRENPDMPDDVFVNYLVETKQQWVVDSLKHWNEHAIAVIASNCIMIDYDEVCDKIPDLVLALNKLVKAKKSIVELTQEKLAFDKMQQRYDEGFVRRGIVGGYSKYLDPFTLGFIKRHVNNVNVRH